MKDSPTDYTSANGISSRIEHSSEIAKNSGSSIVHYCNLCIVHLLKLSTTIVILLKMENEATIHEKLLQLKCNDIGQYK